MTTLQELRVNAAKKSARYVEEGKRFAEEFAASVLFPAVKQELFEHFVNDECNGTYSVVLDLCELDGGCDFCESSRCFWKGRCNARVCEAVEPVMQDVLQRLFDEIEVNGVFVVSEDDFMCIAVELSYDKNAYTAATPVAEQA